MGQPSDVSRSSGAPGASLAAGSRVAGYRLEEQIGVGADAVAYRAVDERLGRQVALKIVAPVLAADPAIKEGLIREWRAVAAVDHPHIIPLFEAGESGGLLFLAMRYVPGKDAGALVQRDGPLPPGRAAAFTSAIASALDSMHAAGLLHRDVRPSNILVDSRPGLRDHVYLTGFGLSAAALSSHDRTIDWQVGDSAAYMPPELIEGRGPGRTGRRVFAGLHGIRAADRRAAVHSRSGRRAPLGARVGAAPAADLTEGEPKACGG